MNSPTSRDQTQYTENSRITLNGKLLVFLTAMIFCVSLFLMVNITSAMAQTSHSDHTEGSLLDSHDMDGDGLSDTLENMLGTDSNNKYGDMDNDGLYDFEEYLDHYGTPENTTDSPKYKYNVSTTYENVLDIYHYFNLSENKAGHIRDNSTYTEENEGFTNYLLWNVTFSAVRAGGSRSSNVTYENNYLVNVTFAEEYAGGSESGNVAYENNYIVNVTFAKRYAGGSESGNVTYENNHIVNVTFAESYAGGSNDGVVIYMNNSLVNVTFTGGNSGGGSDSNSTTYINNSLVNVVFTGGDSGGGSESGNATYMNNHLVNVIFNGLRAGGSRDGAVTYINNTLISVIFSGEHTGMSDKTGSPTIYRDNQFSDVQYSNIPRWEDLVLISENNVIVSDLYDSDNDSLGDVRELFELKLNPEDKDTDGDSLNDGWEVLYNSSTPHVDPRRKVGINITDLTASDLDNDNLTFSQEEKLGTNPNANDTDGDGLNDSYEVNEDINTSPISYDTDGDGLNDGWEVQYSNVTGVNPIIEANSSVLASDEDRDGLTLLEESVADTDPLSNDTDGDGLLDGWEARYSGSSGVDPHVNVTEEELSSDEDGDGLYLREEALIGTNPDDNDTDGDGLLDDWELQYNETFGINPTIKASSSELESDEDRDGLTLLGESVADTDPSLNDTDGDGLLDGWEARYSGSSGVDPHVNVTANEELFDQDSDGLTLMEEYNIGSSPLSNDTDGDGLSDSWEASYSGSSGVDPLDKASPSELISDEDDDGLSLREEALVGTNPMVNDTDGDGLNDGWEKLYVSLSNVDPLVKASFLELESDLDLDTLTMLEESVWGTHPLNSDTDDDGLNDGWEAKYNNTYGVNPLSKATNEELFSDRDGDGLTLLQESVENLDPEIADNTQVSGTTVVESGINFYFVLIVAITTAIIIAIIIITVTVIIRIRRYRKRTLQKWRKML